MIMERPEKIETFMYMLMKEARRNIKCENSNVSPNTIQAVKYAMKHTHPDNGGNAEDFIKFQKVYEELTNK